MREEPDKQTGQAPMHTSKGVVWGAGAGMVIGAALGDAGTGMVLGAGLGLVVGLVRGRRDKR